MSAGARSANDGLADIAVPLDPATSLPAWSMALGCSVDMRQFDSDRENGNGQK
jgi:hypothetical protein